MALKDRTLNFNLSQQLNRALLKSATSTARLNSATFVQGDKIPVNMRFLEEVDGDLKDIALGEEIIEVCARWKITNEQLFTPALATIETHGVGLNEDNGLFGGIDLSSNPQGANFVVGTSYAITQEGLDLGARVRVTEINAQGAFEKGTIEETGAGYNSTKSVTIENPLGDPSPSQGQTLTKSIASGETFEEIDFHKNALLELDVDIPDAPQGVLLQTGKGEGRNTQFYDLSQEANYETGYYLAYTQMVLNSNSEVTGWTLSNPIDAVEYYPQGGTQVGIKINRDTTGANNQYIETSLINPLEPGFYDLNFGVFEHTSVNDTSDSYLDIQLSTDGGANFTSIKSIDLINFNPYQLYQNLEFEVPVTMAGVNFIRIKYEESSNMDNDDYFAFTQINIVKRGESFGWGEENKVNANCNFDYWHDSLKKTSSSVDFITTDVTLVDGDYYLELIGSSVVTKPDSANKESSIYLKVQTSTTDTQSGEYKGEEDNLGTYEGIGYDVDTGQLDTKYQTEHLGGGIFRFVNEFTISDGGGTRTISFGIEEEGAQFGIESIKIIKNDGSGDEVSIDQVQDWVYDSSSGDDYTKRALPFAYGHVSGSILASSQTNKNLSHTGSGEIKLAVNTRPYEFGSGVNPSNADTAAKPLQCTFLKDHTYRLEYELSSGGASALSLYADSGDFTWQDSTTGTSFTPTSATGTNVVYFKSHKNHDNFEFGLSSATLNYFKICDITNALAQFSNYAAKELQTYDLYFRDIRGLDTLGHSINSTEDKPDIQKIVTATDIKAGTHAFLHLRQGGVYSKSQYGNYPESTTGSNYYKVYGYNEKTGWEWLSFLSNDNLDLYGSDRGYDKARLTAKQDIEQVAIELDGKWSRITEAYVQEFGSRLTSFFNANGELVTSVGLSGEENNSYRATSTIQLSEYPVLTGQVRISYFIDYDNNKLKIFANSLEANAGGTSMLDEVEVGAGFGFKYGNKAPWSSSYGSLFTLYNQNPVLPTTQSQSDNFSGSRLSLLNYYKGVRVINLSSDDITGISLSSIAQEIRYNVKIDLDGVYVHSFFDLGFDEGQAVFDVQARNSTNTEIRTLAQFHANIYRDVNFNGSSGTPFVP